MIIVTEVPCEICEILWTLSVSNTKFYDSFLWVHRKDSYVPLFIKLEKFAITLIDYFCYDLEFQ